MVIEHHFITTLESADALRRAADYLMARNFSAAESGGFAVGEPGKEWTTLEMRRGIKRAARAKNVTQLPQTVRLEWNRGRISAALSIAANAAWGGSAALSIGGESAGNLKKMQLHTDLLTAIAQGLEQLLAYNGSGLADYSTWDSVENNIRKAARRRTNRNLFILLAFLGLAGALVAVAIIYG